MFRFTVITESEVVHPGQRCTVMCVFYCLFPSSWVLVLASTLWEPLLQAGGPACLHDRQYDVWLPEPKGASPPALVSICSSFELLIFIFFLPWSFQQSVEGIDRCCRLYCVLSAGVLSCYFTPEEIEAKVPPTLRVAIDKVWNDFI